MLQQTGITDRIHIDAMAGKIVITPVNSLRAGWEAAFTDDPMTLTAEDRQWLEADLLSSDEELIP